MQMKRLAALPLALAAAFGVAHAATTTKYLIISENAGKQIGQQVVEHQDDGNALLRIHPNRRGLDLLHQRIHVIVAAGDDRATRGIGHVVG